MIGTGIGRHPLRGLLVSAVAAVMLAAPSSGARAAESERIKELERKLEQSLKTVDALADRVNQLEVQVKVKNAAPAESAKSVAKAQNSDVRVAALEQSVASLSESLSKQPGDTGLPIHGFLDVGMGGESPIDGRNFPASQRNHARRGFNAGTLDFYMTPQFGSRIKTLMELAVEYDSNGGQAVDLERGQIGYLIADNTTLWGGRFHTPYGYWNTAFHHGAQFQTTITRPRFLEFEDKGGLLPAHSVGAWLNGAKAAGDGKVTYDFYVANGDKIMAGDNANKVLDFNPVSNDNNAMLAGFNLGYQWSNGLKLGAHGFRDQVTTYAGTGSDTSTVLNRSKVAMLGGYGFYDNDDWEIISEYYHWNNTAESGFPAAGVVGAAGRHSSEAWFAQAGYSLYGGWIPYARYEKAALNPNDVFFNSLNSGRSYNRLVLGMRWNLDPRAALKIELSHTSEKAGQQLNTAGPVPDSFGDASYSRIQGQYSVSF